MNDFTPSLLDDLVPADVSAHLRAGAVVTIGNFDGVHLGHQVLIGDARADAARRGAQSVALTFEPHPAAIFANRSQDTFRITTSAERHELLEHYGIDKVVTVDFTREFAGLPPETFVRELLIERLHARAVHIGYDFAFGRGRQGNTESLQRLCGEAGVQVVVHHALTEGETPISSTRVREHVQAGELDTAAALLGHRYVMTGTQRSGAQRGRAMQIPTVNLYPAGRMLPRRGVYASLIRADGAWLPSISNLGARPTFNDGDTRVSLETHILTDADANLAELQTSFSYGADVGVALLRFIRDEHTFASTEELRAQIGKDVRAASAIHASLGVQAGAPCVAGNVLELPTVDQP